MNDKRKWLQFFLNIYTKIIHHISRIFTNKRIININENLMCKRKFVYNLKNIGIQTI